MLVTGFAMYGEGSQMGSWQERLFGWVIPLFGQSQDVHTWHHLGMWGLVIFASCTSPRRSADMQGPRSISSHDGLRPPCLQA